MTIDLRDAHCDCCGEPAYLYRLVGTLAGLCAGCFARWHG